MSSCVGEYTHEGAGVANAIDIARLASQFEDQPGAAGMLDLSVALRAQGRTWREIRSSLEGQLWVVARDGVATSDYVTQLGRGADEGHQEFCPYDLVHKTGHTPHEEGAEDPRGS